MPVAEGTEILLADRGRRPAAWTDVLGPTQYAAFLSDAGTALPYSASGVPEGAAEYTCTVFDSLEAAERFGEERVRLFPHLRCDVFDAEGRAHPPLLVITHPDRKSGESSPASSRRRRVAALVLILAAGPLVWLDWQNDFGLVLPAFLGLTCVIAAVRLIHWDLGVRFQEQERRRRVDELRGRERQG